MELERGRNRVHKWADDGGEQETCRPCNSGLWEVARPKRNMPDGILREAGPPTLGTLSKNS